MEQKEKILAIIFEAIGDFNKTVPEERRLKPEAATALLADAGGLDSLDLLNFSMNLEEKIERDFKCAMGLFDLDHVGKDNPFRTVTTLADYLAALLERKDPPAMKKL